MIGRNPDVFNVHEELTDLAELSGKEHSAYVQSMFSHLARRYDRANRWMSWGQDRKWRKEVLKIAQLPAGGRVLDIGTGTGDLALEAYKQDPGSMVVGADFTARMMELGSRIVAMSFCEPRSW